MEDKIIEGLGKIKTEVGQTIEKVKEEIPGIAESKAKEAITPLQTAVEEIKGATAKMQEQMDGIATEMKKASKQKFVSFKNTIREALEERAKELKGLKEGDRMAGFRLEIKDAAPMSITDNVTGEIPVTDRLPGVNTLRTRTVRLLSLAQTMSTTSNRISWAYQTAIEGGAGQTAEGAAKSQMDTSFAVGYANVEKTTCYVKVTDEMLEDIDFIAALINNELTRRILLMVETQAYQGDGTTPNLEGLLEVATPFTTGGPASGTVVNPTIIDCIDAARTQIFAAHQEVPNAVLLNPWDVLALRTTKVDNTDRNDYAYRAGLIVENGTTYICGIPVIETTLVGAGTFVVGDFTKFNIAQRKGISIEVGLDGEDFTKNFKTIRAEWRGAAFVKHNDRTAFVADSFADVIADLAKS